MPFTKKCGGKYHKDTTSCGPLISVYGKRIGDEGRRLTAEERDQLITKGIINARTTFVCEDCANVLDTVENYFFRMTTLIKNDIKKLRNQKVNVDDCIMYDAKTWLNDRPKELVANLKVLCNISEVSTSCDYLRLALIIETIYCSWNNNIILPQSFSKNILTQSRTHSKESVMMISKIVPGSTYQNIDKMLYKESLPVIHFPESDVKAMFDNSQIIGKSWALKPCSEMPKSIITTHAQIPLKSNLQWRSDLKPKHWWFQKSTKIVESPNIHFFRQFRDEFLRNRLHHFKHCNDVAKKVSDRRKWFGEVKFCTQCGSENDDGYRRCRITDCGGALEKRKFDHKISIETGGKDEEVENPDDFYCIYDNDFVTQEKNQRAYHVICGEPDMLNPNTYENISHVLRNLGKRSGIERYGNGNRQWIMLEVDAPIYKIVNELINNTYSCKKCDSSFYGKQIFDEHECEVTSEETEMEFDWIVLLPGLLHVEMNACKAFIEWNWNVFVKRVAFDLGYETEKALNMILKCKDHHKTWRLCELLLYGCTDELLRPYAEAMQTPSVDGYWKWVKENQEKLGKNYNYMLNMILDVLLALVCFRISVRRNNYDGMITSFEKLSTLFFGRSHPIYQKVYVNFVKLNMKMPSEVKNLYKKNMACSSTVNTMNNCQGGDALLEELNKKLKYWLTDAGVPTEEHWLKTIRMLEKLEKLKENFDRQLGRISSQSNREKKVPYIDVAYVRSTFRLEKYFEKENGHTSLGNEKEIDDDLIYYQEAAGILKKKIISGMTDENFQNERPIYVCVTKEEKENALKISNMTKKELSDSIKNLTDSLERDDLLYEFKSSVEGKKKEFYVNFFIRLKELESC